MPELKDVLISKDIDQYKKNDTTPPLEADDLLDKAEIDGLINTVIGDERMRWAGIFLDETYALNDVVRSEGWLSVSMENDNDDAPAPDMDPAAFTLEPYNNATPGASAVAAAAPLLTVGYRFEAPADDGLIIDTIKVGNPNAPGMELLFYELWIVVDPLLEQTYDPPRDEPAAAMLVQQHFATAGNPVWHEHKEGIILLRPGWKMDIYLSIYKDVDVTGTDLSYQYFKVNAPPAAGQIFHKPGKYMNFHKEDQAAADNFIFFRDTVQVGWKISTEAGTIHKKKKVWTIKAKNDKSAEDYYQFQVKPTGRGKFQGEITDFKFFAPNEPEDITYFKVTNQLAAIEYMNGFEFLGDYDPALVAGAMDKTGYGLEVNVQQGYIPTKWAFLAYSPELVQTEQIQQLGARVTELERSLYQVFVSSTNLGSQLSIAEITAALNGHVPAEGESFYMTDPVGVVFVVVHWGGEYFYERLSRAT